MAMDRDELNKRRRDRELARKKRQQTQRRLYIRLAIAALVLGLIYEPLMNILGCLDRPTNGTYLLNGQPVSDLTGSSAADIRNQKIGFVFQSFNLISSMSALENVELPLVLRGESRKIRRQKALEALARVGLQDRAGHRPAELSGGQQQRVAIARVLAAQPPLILADEPTGNLDGVTSREILSILRQLHREGQTIVMITHDDGIAAAAPRQMRMEQGRLSTLETN